MYATLGPNWRVPLRNSAWSRSYVFRYVFSYVFSYAFRCAFGYSRTVSPCTLTVDYRASCTSKTYVFCVAFK